MTAAEMALDGLSLGEWRRHFEQHGEAPAVPAATVVVLRDGSAGAESLMLRRNSSVAFGGMWVFPGGRIDPGDYDGSGDLVAAARNAAAREAREEAAVDLDPAALVHFSFWIPPPIAPRRYATWFFAATAPEGDVTIDDGEIVRHEWMTPAEAMRRRDDGEIELAPPTWVTLHTLRELDSAWPSGAPRPAGASLRAPGRGAGDRPGAAEGRSGRAAEVVAGLARRRPRRYETRIGLGPAGPVSMWHGDAGYDTGDPTAAGPRHRLEVTDGAYRLLELQANPSS